MSGGALSKRACGSCHQKTAGPVRGRTVARYIVREHGSTPARPKRSVWRPATNRELLANPTPFPCHRSTPARRRAPPSRLRRRPLTRRCNRPLSPLWRRNPVCCVYRDLPRPPEALCRHIRATTIWPIIYQAPSRPSPSQIARLLPPRRPPRPITTASLRPHPPRLFQ